MSTYYELSNREQRDIHCLALGHDWIVHEDDGVIECECCEACIEVPLAIAASPAFVERDPSTAPDASPASTDRGGSPS